MQFTKRDDLANLKSEVDKLDIDKLQKSAVDKLDFNKLKLVPADLTKIIDVSDDDVVNIMARSKILKIKYLVLLT